ncbi:MAG: hypothetical protein ACP5UV_07195 [Thermoplasmata archaeon]
MIRFRESVNIRGSAEKVFMAVSDVGRIMEFWHGTRSLARECDHYKIRFAFPSTGRVAFISHPESKNFETEYLSGPIKGRKIETISQADGYIVLASEWDVNLTPFLRPFEARIGEHFRSGTKSALDRIKIACEEKMSDK